MKCGSRVEVFDMDQDMGDNSSSSSIDTEKEHQMFLDLLQKRATESLKKHPNVSVNLTKYISTWIITESDTL